MPDRIADRQTRLFHLTACLIISVLAFLPALTHSGLPAGTDVALHFWRVVDLSHNWQQGDVLARWSELYYYGYGAPSFQYSAMGFYALAALADALPFVDTIAAIKLIWFVSLFAAALGMLRFGLKRWTMPAALVSAAAYTFAPALILHESLLRGSFGVVLGMGFAALALSLLDDVLARRKHLIPFALCLFVVLMSHNITAVMFGGVLFAWMLWQIAVHRPRFALWGLAAFVAGCALAGFFWVPLAFELRLVDVERMGLSVDLDYRQGFHSLASLLGFPRPLDTALLNPPPQTTLGLAQWILAAFGGLAALLTLRQRLSREMIFWVGVALAAIFLMIPPAAPVWERFTPLQQILFPIRFLNVAALALAVLAGMAVHAAQSAAQTRLSRNVLKTVIPAAALIALGFVGLMSTPWLWRDDLPHEPRPADYLAYEIETGVLGTTAANEFLPPTVSLIPPPTGFVIDSIAASVGASVAAGEPVQRLNLTAYPEGTQIEVLASSPTRYAFTVETSTPLTLEVMQLYFPLWQAFINGEAVTARPSEPYGFTLIDVPAGMSRVEIVYPLTGPQGLGLAVSGLALAGLFAYGLFARRIKPASPVKDDHAVRDGVPRSQVFMFAGVVLVWALTALLVHTQITGYVTSAPDESLSADHAANAVYEDTAVLSGFSTHEPYTGRVWEVDLYWRFKTDEPVNSFVHVLNGRGEIIAQLDKLGVNMAEGVPSGIHPDVQFRDTYVMYAPEGLPPDALQGPYQLRVGLWRCLDEVNRFDCAGRTTPTVIGGSQRGAEGGADGWILLDYP